MMNWLRNFHRDERGFILPLLFGLTTIMNLINRQNAMKTLDEDVVTEGQAQEGTIQEFADRGLTVGADSPVVQEALRRRSLAKRQQRAQMTLGSGDPFATLFGFFNQR